MNIYWRSEYSQRLAKTFTVAASLTCGSIRTLWWVVYFSMWDLIKFKRSSNVKASSLKNFSYFSLSSNQNTITKLLYIPLASRFVNRGVTNSKRFLPFFFFFKSSFIEIIGTEIAAFSKIFLIVSAEKRFRWIW